MDELGTRLVQARQELGLSLDDVANRTMVSKKYLRALETGDYKVFPGEVYLKGALRKYAMEAGLDPKEAVAMYESTKLKEAESPENPPNDREVAVPAKPRQLPAQKRFRLRYDRLIAILVIIGLLAALAYSFSYFGGRQADINDPQGEPPEPEPGPVEEEPSQVPEPEPVKALVKSEETTGQLAVTVEQAEALDVEMFFDSLCWVQVYADGAPIQENTFRAGETFPFSATGNATLRVGNPAALTLKVNGEVVEFANKVNPMRVEIELR